MGDRVEAKLQGSQGVRTPMLLALSSHTRYRMIGWFGTMPSQGWVSVTLSDPGAEVTPYPLSDKYDKLLGLVSLI